TVVAVPQISSAVVVNQQVATGLYAPQVITYAAPLIVTPILTPLQVHQQQIVVQQRAVRVRNVPRVRQNRIIVRQRTVVQH
ncbi:MAG: hypothetical protein SGJ20_11475, partial [Planctomycetota bacterium]|nr:hypothetical protein [Planctomycetota bacterium]